MSGRKAGIICVLAAAAFGCAAAKARHEAGLGLETLDFRAVVKAVKEKVFPSVVFIKCIREGHEKGEKKSQEVAGSGVIISGSGEVLTNWHVVDKAVEIRCLLFDGRSLTASTVGTDKDTDLARQDAEPAEGRIERWKERLLPWGELARMFRADGFYERFAAKGQVERVSRIHRELCRTAAIAPAPGSPAQRAGRTAPHG